MKILKLLLFASVLVLLVSGSASAAFSFDFTTACNIDGWTVGAGVWSATTCHLKETAAIQANIYTPIGAGQKHIEFNWSAISYGAGISQNYYWAGTSKGLNIDQAGAGATGHLNGVGFVYTKNNIFSGTNPYRIVADIINNDANIRIRVYFSNGTLYPGADDTIAYTYAESDNFKISTTDVFSANAFQIQRVSTSAVSPTSSTAITWGASEYTVGDTATFSWAITDSDWNTFLNRPYDVRVIDQTGNEHNFGSFYVPCLCFTQFGIGTQTGSYSFLVDNPGSYTAHLDSFISTDVSTAQMVVNVASSAFIIINSSVPYHTQVPVTYNFGFGGVNLNDAIQTFYLDPATGTYQFEHSFFGLSSGTNTRNVYFEKVGTYILKLRDLAQDKTFGNQAQTVATFSVPETVITIANTTINITKTNYAYGDTIFGNYTIDSTNWTAGQIYLDVFNWDKGIVTTQMQGVGTGWVDISTSQVGNILVNLLNVPANQNFQATTFISGNNALRIMLKNTTGVTNVLASANFTLKDVKANGYGLTLSKYSVLTGEKFFAYATVPENGAKLILINTGLDVSTGKLLANIGTNTSPATIPISIPNSGNYAIILNNPANDTEAMQNVVVTMAAATSTATTIPPGEAGNQASNDVTALLTSLTFWAFLIIAGIMMYVGWKTKHYIPTSIVGMSGLGVFTFVGWVPTWLFFSVLVILAYLLAKSQVSSETDTGTGGSK